MAKVLFCSNIIRRYSMMQQALNSLKEEASAIEGECFFLNAETEWTEKKALAVAEADIVIIKWMGTGIETPFLRNCLNLLKKKNTIYHIDATGNRNEELINGLVPGQVELLRQYSMLGGENNFRNLWRYADFVAGPKAEKSVEEARLKLQEAAHEVEEEAGLKLQEAAHELEENKALQDDAVKSGKAFDSSEDSGGEVSGGEDSGSEVSGGKDSGDLLEESSLCNLEWLWEKILHDDGLGTENIHKDVSLLPLDFRKKLLESLAAPAVSLPDPVHWCGIYHPRADKVYTELAAYRRDFCKEGRVTIGLMFYRDEWVWGDLQYQSALIEEIEKRGMNAICIFSNGMPVEEMGMPALEEIFQRFFFVDGISYIDAFIMLTKFSFTAAGSLQSEFLKKWNIPVLNAYTLMTSYEDWKDNLEGMTPIEVSISVSLPEFDGVIHGVPVACKEMQENGDTRYIAIDDGIKRMVKKAEKWGSLRKKANADKKIAIIFHNYPPKNSNIGSAFGMDSIESVRRLLQLLAERGYKVDYVPEDSKSFIKLISSHATNDREMLTEKQLEKAEKIADVDYEDFLSTKEPAVVEQMEKDWGKAPGEIMHYGDKLLVPGVFDGNIFITVQPPRGFGENPEKLYHDPFTAPTHHYLAFYQWLRDKWQADAVAHIGTHGSLEWLPGKNAGLSASCYPDLALGELPDVYPYNMTITGEGMQAKRRGAACVVEHLPAPQTQAGVYDELEELEKMMEEYIHFQRTQPENLPDLKEMLLKKAEEAEILEEVNYDEAEDFSVFLANLHNYLTELKNMVVHNGLHILGQEPQGEDLRESLWLLTCLDNGNIPGMNATLAALFSKDYYELIEKSCEIDEATGLTNGMLVDKIRNLSLGIVEFLMEAEFKPEAAEKVCSEGELRRLLEKLAGEQSEEVAEATEKKIAQTAEYICRTLYPALMLTKQELDNTVRAFSGEYVEAGPSGAPSSGGAGLLPSGRNFYGIDPRSLPTKAAWVLGNRLGDEVISRFIAEEGHYPENIGIVLWAGANMRSHGQCVAEFLYLLGVKPVWQKGSLKVKNLEVIPIEELQRPRIDVTGRISGLFRDALPCVAELLDKAVLMVASLDESHEVNYIKKHVDTDAEAIMAEDGLSREEARREASFRIFGDSPGTYGAGVGGVLEARNWESVDDLADVYVRWGAHAYGGKVRGKFLPDRFRKRMGSIDITIKNEDNHETNMLSSDDFNAYHGGMVATVRSIKGSAPKSYCGDSSDRSRVQLRSLQEEMKRTFRSEAINPKFIKGMMKHGYKGAADLANYVAHSFQWDATSCVMEDWMYEKYAEKYAFDKVVQEWMKDVNPWALKRLTEVLLEAQQRGMWQAKAETLSELRNLYLEMEGDMEDMTDE